MSWQTSVDDSFATQNQHMQMMVNSEISPFAAQRVTQHQPYMSVPTSPTQNIMVTENGQQRYSNNPYAITPTQSNPPPMPSQKSAVPMMDHAAAATSRSHPPVSFEELSTITGQIESHARTPTGSSFVQAALRDGDPRCTQLIWSELKPSFDDLLLDINGCYVLKTVMEQMPQEELQLLLGQVAGDEQLLLSICTHTLHSRRMFQFLLDKFAPQDFAKVAELMTRRCVEIAMTQQGCIAMQRVIAQATPEQKQKLLRTIHDNFVTFAFDPFANYVVQYVLESEDKEVNSKAVLEYFGGKIYSLSCNKFASNVIEKCLFHLTPEAQHAVIGELYMSSEEDLERLLQDSFGNYIVQSSIALASFRDVFTISEKLRGVLTRTPYGHKIMQRLERRLRGKPVATRSFPQQVRNSNPKPQIPPTYLSAPTNGGRRGNHNNNNQNANMNPNPQFQLQNQLSRQMQQRFPQQYNAQLQQQTMQQQTMQQHMQQHIQQQQYMHQAAAPYTQVPNAANNGVVFAFSDFATQQAFAPNLNVNVMVGLPQTTMAAPISQW